MIDPSSLAHQPPTRKTGTEPFHHTGSPLPVTLELFWQWSASDLASNSLRGHLAEFVIAHALGIDDGLRTEWDAFDLLTPAGLRIEVKSAAYLQSWRQTRPSTILFSTKKAHVWNPETNRYADEPTHSAHLYIFALLAHQTSKATLDPLDLDQWLFYLAPTELLNRRSGGHRSITLKVLQRLCPTPTPFRGLAEGVHALEHRLL